MKIGEHIDNQVSMNEYLEFFCMPGTLKIQSNQTGVMNVMVKVNNDKLEKAEKNEEGKVVSKNLLKLLIAKILDTNMIFYFLFNVELV